MTRVIFSDWSRAYDQSLAYDRSRVFQLESGIRPESRLLTRVGHTIGVASSDRSQI
jgi:hypothetical protein